jgi:hypothetical protein
MVGIIPMLAAAVIDEHMLEHSLTVSKQFADYLQRHGVHDREKLRESGLQRGAREPAATAVRGGHRPAGEGVYQAVR